MSTTTPEVATRPTYGNWIAARSPGLFGAGLIGTAVLFSSLLAALLALLIGGWQPAVTVGVIGVAGFTVTGTPFGSLVYRRWAFRQARKARDTWWRSGVFGKGNAAETRLPGKLGTSRLVEGRDQFGRPFAVVRNGPFWTIVLRCSADGLWMQDPDTVNAWVARWAVFLAACGHEPGLVCAKAINDTAPDPGGQLGSMVQALRSPHGESLSRQVMDELVATMPAASSTNTTYIELTFRGRLLNRRGDQQAILTELTRKTAGLHSMVEEAGGGSVEMVTPTELAQIVRLAFDPATQAAIELAEIEGREAEVSWPEAGPVAYEERWGDFLHDSGHSVTWEMYRAPRSKITEQALAGLMAPHADFGRKRVALIYRPHTPDEAARVAERDISTASFLTRQTGKKRVSESSKLVLDAAQQSSVEVASGAGSVRFSIMVTATVLASDDLAQAVSTAESRAGAVPIRIRRCYGSQAAAFATTLPVGFVPWEHTKVPASVRAWL